MSTKDISTILNQIDNGFIALPEFQRGYVWNRDQIRGLFDSLYRRHPIGGLLIWETEVNTTQQRGDFATPSGHINLLLDGQQRMTTLYGVVRGKPPRFFDGDPKIFDGLRFHLESEIFAFYQPIKMQDDPLWIDVTALMKAGINGVGEIVKELSAYPEINDRQLNLFVPLNRLVGITDILINIEDVTGDDKTIDVVVNIFNRVNSGGTKLSKGDLALAKICSEWPEARNVMKRKLEEWSSAGYNFNLDWLLRSLNTVLTGEAKFSYLHAKNTTEIQNGLKRAMKHIDFTLNLIAGRLGLDHDRVLFGRYSIPVIVRYLDRINGELDRDDSDKLLFWFAQAGMWGRFSGSTESAIDRDLAKLEGPDGGFDALIEELHLSQGGLRVRAGHFGSWSRGARFYPLLYMLTRVSGTRDFCSGIELKATMLGKMSSLELHHIFPKSRLNRHDKGYSRPQINALGNYCFLTKDCNLRIRDRLPEKYLLECEERHPGVLRSQWIPMDTELWKMDRYLDFLEARKVLLAEAANKYFENLLHGDSQILMDVADEPLPSPPSIASGITSDDEERELERLNSWVEKHGLPSGQMSFDYSDPQSGVQRAVFDLVWENGLQPGLTEPVAILLNESAAVLSLANEAGFKCFVNVSHFQNYVESEILNSGQ